MRFGLSDYRRPAGAIIVPGARAHANGRPSVALADRMRTACELYREGYAPLLVVSGGPGDGAFHETDVMRRMALAGGVPASAIEVDPGGINSRATAENVSALLRARGVESALVVSHAYHLPRLKLVVERQGLRAYTVPARESHVIAKMPYFVAREAAYKEATSPRNRPLGGFSNWSPPPIMAPGACPDHGEMLPMARTDRLLVGLLPGRRLTSTVTPRVS